MFAAVVLFSDSNSAKADGPVRACDSVWEVSSRGLSECPRTDECPELTVTRQLDCLWRTASMSDLLVDVGTEPPARTVIYVHGNWMCQPEARSRALTVYRTLCARKCEPVRFIAFSWPSEREDHFARDVIGKKNRLDADAYYLATLLQQLPPDEPMGLVGFSFGGPVICGALHLAGGGTLAGRQVCAPTSPEHCVRVSLMAPAFDRTALTHCGRYRQALVKVDQMVNLYNSSDPILRRFRFFDRSTSPVAAGFAGILEPRSSEPLHPNPKILQFDCRGSIGRTHAELAYLKCRAYYRAIENVLGR